MPTGSATPRASRSRPASSIAATRLPPAKVTRIARRSSTSASRCAEASATSALGAADADGRLLVPTSSSPGSTSISPSSEAVDGSKSGAASTSSAEGITRATGGSASAAGSEARRDLAGVERTEHPQQIGDALDALHATVGIEALHLGLELSDHVGIEQLAHLDASEQFAQQGGVDGQRGGPALGERRVALVHERADISEEQIAGEGRRLAGLRLDEADAALGDAARHAQQRGQVVDVLQHLAQRLEDDRERRMPAGHLEQLCRPLPLLPQRAALVGVHARHQQGARRALAEPGGEQRRAADLVRDDLLELVGLEDEQLGARRLGRGIRHPRDDAVVARDRRSLHPEPFP